MVSKSAPTVIVFNHNKHGLKLKWPHIWIIILAILSIFFNLCISGMEVGHTVIDTRRGTAFGGFIIFIPLLICSILILITAWKPTLALCRASIAFCYLSHLLNGTLIGYCVMVLIDPTRCFFLDCSVSVVNASSSTTILIGSGWPLNVSWPNYFLLNMINIRIFHSVQILCAVFFMLWCILYELTYRLYRHASLTEKMLIANQPVNTRVVNQYGTDDNERVRTKNSYDNFEETPAPHGTKSLITTYTIGRNSSPPPKYATTRIQSSAQHNPNHPVTAYRVERSATPEQRRYSTEQPAVIETVSPKKVKRKIVVRSRANSISADKLCTRCMEKPRMVLTSNYERQNYFSHLCADCNQEVASDRRKPHVYRSAENSQWK